MITDTITLFRVPTFLCFAYHVGKTSMYTDQTVYSLLINSIVDIFVFNVVPLLFNENENK